MCGGDRTTQQLFTSGAAGRVIQTVDLSGGSVLLHVWSVDGARNQKQLSAIIHDLLHLLLLSIHSSPNTLNDAIEE